MSTTFPDRRTPATTTPLAPTSTGDVGTSILYARGDHAHPAQTSVTGSSGSTTGNAGTATKLQTARTINGVSFDGSGNITIPTGISSVTPSSPSRSLGSTFQPSATNPVLVNYAITSQVTNPLLAGSSSAMVQLFSDTNATSTTERCRVGAVSSVGVAVAIAITTSNTASLSYLVPPGHNVRLVSTVSGTATNTIVAQTEEVLS